MYFSMPCLFITFLLDLLLCSCSMTICPQPALQHVKMVERANPRQFIGWDERGPSGDKNSSFSPQHPNITLHVTTHMHMHSHFAVKIVGLCLL
ncbi:hypothetical protein J3E69DRAFT_329901, partial [Trichoderma sp. SZMC 28015]